MEKLRASILITLACVTSTTAALGQTGDPYSTKNPNRAADYQRSVQKYSQGMIDQIRSDMNSSNKPASVSGYRPTATAPRWDLNSAKGKREYEAHLLYEKKIAEQKAEYDALVKANVARHAATTALEAPYKKYLLDAGFNDIELNAATELQHAGPDAMNAYAFGLFAGYRDYLVKNIKTAGFTPLYQTIQELSNNALHYTAYEFYDQLVERFPQNKDSLTGLNIILLRNAFTYPAMFQVPAGLMAKSRTRLNLHRERIGKDYLMLVYPDTSRSQETYDYVEKRRLISIRQPNHAVADWLTEPTEMALYRYRRKLGKSETQELIKNLFALGGRMMANYSARQIK